MKFSIIVPVYKSQFLTECIESVLSQNYRDWELILVNDASPYDIDSLILRYNDKRIRYRKRNIGFGVERLVDNWNDCLRYASGEYVMCIGDDDRLLPNCLKDYADLISRYPDKNLYHTRTEIIDEESDVINIQEDRPETESVYSMIWHFWKGRRQWIGDWLFRMSTLRNNGGFYNLPCAWGSDNISAFVAALDTGVANCRKVGFQYRVSCLSISENKDDYTYEKMKAWLLVKDWYQDFLLKIPTDKQDALYRELLIKMLEGRIYADKFFDIHENVLRKPVNICKWFRARKELDLSCRLLFGVTALVCREKIFKH